MKRHTWGMALCVVCLFAGAAMAGEASAVAKVFVNINANVGIVPATLTVNAGTIQTGEFTATASFNIRASVEQLQFMVEASDLYKGDDPNNAAVSPIPVKHSAGAVLTTEHANPIGGGTNVHQFILAPGGGPQEGENSNRVAGYPVHDSELKTYESSNNNIWNQSVGVTITYSQPDPLKPVGEYSGVIKLIALVVP